jgi:hypothetical protein
MDEEHLTYATLVFLKHCPSKNVENLQGSYSHIQVFIAISGGFFLDLPVVLGWGPTGRPAAC